MDIGWISHITLAAPTCHHHHQYTHYSCASVMVSPQVHNLHWVFILLSMQFVGLDEYTMA